MVDLKKFFDLDKAKSKSEYPPSEASCAAGAMRGVEVEQWNCALFLITSEYLSEGVSGWDG